MQVWQIVLLIAGAVVFLLTDFVFDGDGTPRPGEHENPPGPGGPRSSEELSSPNADHARWDLEANRERRRPGRFEAACVKASRRPVEVFGV